MQGDVGGPNAEVFGVGITSIKRCCRMDGLSHQLAGAARYRVEILAERRAKLLEQPDVIRSYSLYRRWPEAA